MFPLCDLVTATFMIPSVLLTNFLEIGPGSQCQQSSVGTMQSQRVLARPISVTYASAAGLETSRRATVSFGEFAHCKSKSRLQNSFVSRTSPLLVPISKKGGKRGALMSPRAVLATVTEVAQVVISLC